MSADIRAVQGSHLRVIDAHAGAPWWNPALSERYHGTLAWHRAALAFRAGRPRQGTGILARALANPVRARGLVTFLARRLRVRREAAHWDLTGARDGSPPLEAAAQAADKVSTRAARDGLHPHVRRTQWLAGTIASALRQTFADWSSRSTTTRRLGTRWRGSSDVRRPASEAHPSRGQRRHRRELHAVAARGRDGVRPPARRRRRGRPAARRGHGGRARRAPEAGVAHSRFTLITTPATRWRPKGLARHAVAAPRTGADFVDESMIQGCRSAAPRH